jgi:predicted glycoside hydrolase/deacetylase ChbG (UPF0249 family)
MTIATAPPETPGTKPARRLVLCADDYGISPGVDRAIRGLVARGRLNATSVMTVSPHLSRPEAIQLAILNGAHKRVAIGLHVTLTAPFCPLSDGFAPLTEAGTFLPLRQTMLQGLAWRFDRKRVAREVEAQLRAFIGTFGHPPDFVDGHQHVHLLPRISDGVLGVMKELAPDAWVRQCGRAGTAARPWRDLKGHVLDALSRRFRRRAATFGVPTNPGFAGTYTYHATASFTDLFPGFLDGLPDGGVVMCHPGFVDDELTALDPLTGLREQEYAYLAGDAFAELLAARNVELAAPP